MLPGSHSAVNRASLVRVSTTAGEARLVGTSQTNTLGISQGAPGGWDMAFQSGTVQFTTLLELPLSFGDCNPPDHKELCSVLACRARLINWSGTRNKARVSRSEHLRAILSPSIGDLLVACTVTTQYVPKRDKLDQTTRWTGWSLLLRLSWCRTDAASCLDDIVGCWQAAIACLFLISCSQGIEYWTLSAACLSAGHDEHLQVQSQG